MGDFKLGLIIIKNASNVKRKLVSLSLIIFVSTILLYTQRKGLQGNDVAMPLWFIYLVWCIRMVPVNEICEYSVSPLVLTSPCRKRLLIQTITKWNIFLNLFFYLFLAGIYGRLFLVGQIDGETFTACILANAVAGFLITMYLMIYYKRMWLSVTVLFLIVAAENFFYQFLGDKILLFEYLTETIPAAGVFGIGLVITAFSCLMAWLYAVWTYRRPMDERVVKALLKREKMM